MSHSCATPHGLWPTRLLCPLAFPGKNPGVGCAVAICYPGDLLSSGIQPLFPALAGGFFTIEPPGKPKQLCNCPWKGKAYPQKTTQGGVNTRLYRMGINTKSTQKEKKNGLKYLDRLQREGDVCDELKKSESVF